MPAVVPCRNLMDVHIETSKLGHQYLFPNLDASTYVGQRFESPLLCIYSGDHFENNVGKSPMKDFFHLFIALLGAPSLSPSINKVLPFIKDSDVIISAFNNKKLVRKVFERSSSKVTIYPVIV